MDGTSGRHCTKLGCMPLICLCFLEIRDTYRKKILQSIFRKIILEACPTLSAPGLRLFVTSASSLRITLRKYLASRIGKRSPPLKPESAAYPQRHCSRLFKSLGRHSSILLTRSCL